MKKTLIVIGATADIGIGTIRKIHEDYDTVIAHYRTMNRNLARLKDTLGGKLICIRADLADEEETKQLVGELKGLLMNDVAQTHILHLPAEPIQLRKFHKTPWEIFQRQIDISVRSAVMVLSGLLPMLAKAGGGRVVIMLSMVVDDPPPKYHSDYVMVKSALLALVRSLAAEYAEKRITVNGVSPGLIVTRYLDNMPDYLIAQKAQESPIGRNLEVADIVPAIHFLFSEGAECINGENMRIYGGR